MTITIPVIGTTIPLGDASNGVCGRMVYGVLDLFLAPPRLQPPPDASPPAGGTPITNYILARLVDTFALQFRPASNVVRYIDFMSTLDHDTWLSHGIPSVIVNHEWPKIKQDIDAGRPSPLGLVSGSWVWPTNISAKVKMLGHCHQVLAYSYDLDDDANVTLLVYDPNDPNGDDSTISMNIGNPPRTSPISTPRVTANISGNVTFRAFFRHEFYSPVVPPPGVSPGPIPVQLPTGPPAQGNDMQPGEVLAARPAAHVGQRPPPVRLPGGGNLVLYRNSDGAAPGVREGRHVGRRLHHAGRRQPGDLRRRVVPVWSSDTWHDPGSRLIVQDDGNVVICRPRRQPPVGAQHDAARGADGPAAHGDDMQPGEILPLTSPSPRPAAAIGSSTRATATLCSTTAGCRCGRRRPTAPRSARASCRTAQRVEETEGEDKCDRP